MSSIPWLHRVTPYPAQQRAMFDPPENAVILASPKLGKTVAALQWLIEQTGERGGNHRRFLWVAPNYGQSKIAFRRAYQEVLSLDAIELHKTDHTITLPDTSVIYFGSADKPDNIYGEDYHGIVCDEATRQSLEAWIAISSTVQHTGAKFRLIGNNTRRPNWAKKLAIRARKGELPGWEYHKLNRSDALAAGVIDVATDEATRLLIPADEYRILYEGEDVEREGIFLPTFKLDVEPVPDMVLTCRGWDLASTSGGDWTVGFKIAANSTGFWLLDVVRERLDSHEVPDLVQRTAVEDGPMVEQVFEEEKGSSGKIQISMFRRMLDETPGAGAVYEAPVEVSKTVRAWPLVAQMGAGRYHMAPGFHHSEALAEMEEWPDSQHDDVVDACIAAGSLVATPHGEIPIELIRPGDLVWTRQGWRPVTAHTAMGEQDTVRVEMSNGRVVCATPDHRFATDDGWMVADALTHGTRLVGWTLSPSHTTVDATGGTRIHRSAATAFTSRRALSRAAGSSTVTSTRTTTGRYPKTSSSIMSTATPSTMTRRTLRPLAVRITDGSIQASTRDRVTRSLHTWNRSDPWQQNGIAPPRGASGIVSMAPAHGMTGPIGLSNAWNAGPSSLHATPEDSFASAATRAANVHDAVDARSMTDGVLSVVPALSRTPRVDLERAPNHVVRISCGGRAEVYDLTVADCPEFVVEGVTVHNCAHAHNHLAPLVAGAVGSSVSR